MPMPKSETGAEPPVLAGVRENPDGSPDYSRAVEYRPRGRNSSSINTQVETGGSSENLTEREKSRERAAEIVLEDGGVRVHMSVAKSLSLSPYGSDGFQNLETRIQDHRQPNVVIEEITMQFLSRDEFMRNIRLDNALNDRDIKEIIDIRPEVRPTYETVTVPGKKGVLGFGKMPDRTERKATGRYESILHSEIVSGGKNEPVVRFTYYIPQTEWRDYSGRQGQMMVVEIVLPESAAKELEQILKRDPAAMRQIVEEVMKKRFLEDPGDWEKSQGYGDSLRPPYEVWDAEPNGGRIYLQTAGKEPGFHEDRVYKVKQY